MARKTRVAIRWRRKAFPEMRTMPGVMDELNRMAENMARAAGDGYEAKPAQVTGGRVRGRAAVITATSEAVAENARNHTLTRVMNRKDL